MGEDHLEWRCVLSTSDSILLGLARSMLEKEDINISSKARTCRTRLSRMG
jgi:hypothetical protein